MDVHESLRQELLDTKQALRELLQSATYIWDNHGHQLTGTLKLDEDIRRACHVLHVPDERRKP